MVEVFDNFLDSEEIYYLQQLQKPWVFQSSDKSNPYDLPFLYYAPEIGDFYKQLFEKIKKEIGKHSPITVSYTHLTLPTSDLV